MPEFLRTVKKFWATPHVCYSKTYEAGLSEIWGKLLLMPFYCIEETNEPPEFTKIKRKEVLA